MDANAERKRDFMAAAKGLTPHETARVMNRFCPGVAWWDASSKRDMASAYAAGNAYHSPVRPGLLDALRSAVLSKALRQEAGPYRRPRGDGPPADDPT